MTKSLHRITSVLILALSLISLPAWALSLGDAKSQGLVGERINGYLGIVVKNPGADVKKLVAQINQKRKTAYQQKADNAGVDRGIIEQRIGQRLQQRATRGHYIQTSNGQWQRK